MTGPDLSNKTGPSDRKKWSRGQTLTGTDFAITGPHLRCSACGFSPTHTKQLRLNIVFTQNEIPWLHKRVGHLSRPFLVGQGVWEPDKGEQ